MFAKHEGHLSRRDFLSYVSRNTLAGVVAAVALPGPVFAISKITQHLTLNKGLEFADRQGLGPELDAPDVEKYCCPLHEEKLLPISYMDSPTRKTIKRILKTQFQNAGLEWHEEYEVGFTYQHYGVPDNNERVNSLITFCRKAGQFSHDKLPGMFDAEVNWQPLTSYEPVIRLRAFRGYVGRYTYYVIRAVVLNSENSDDLPYLVQAWPVERAIHYIVSGKTAVPKRGTLYVIPGTTSLVAPFSELLHLTFHEPAQRYAAELSNTLTEDQAREQARIAGETVNEAAAIVLASEFLQKLDHSERLPIVKFMANNLSATYGYLLKAIAFMERNSVQSAVNIFFDSPANFMASIEKA